MTTRIRCKLKCHSVSQNPHSDGTMSIVQFGAVWSEDTGKPDDENAIFGKLTPYGTLSLGMVTEVANKLEQGKEYYVDITPAS